MADTPTRILLAKVGLDGHDRGVKVLARSFRDGGMEVIYTGLWQTPAGTAKAAIEEDADVLGASFHSAAHLTLVPVLMQELEKLGRADMPVVIGGIIPQEDVPVMEAAGVAGVFKPEDSLEHILTSVRKIGADCQHRRQAAWAKGEQAAWLTAAKTGDRTALGRVLSWIESDPSADELAKHLPAEESNTTIVGITGAPGVGKSTLIGRLTKELCDRKKRVAVIAVDPASPITGGGPAGRSRQDGPGRE